MTELENTNTEVKNAFDRLPGRPGSAGESVSLEGRRQSDSQTETEREKNNKNRRDDNENETSMLSGIISEGVKCEYLEYQKEKEKRTDRKKF